MKNFIIEMNYILNINVSVEADTQDEAIKKGKLLIDNNVRIMDNGCIGEKESIDVGELFFEDVTFITN